MRGIASILVVVLCACSGSGFNTGPAMVSANTKIKSAAIKPFTGADGAGKIVRGWTVEFYSEDKGFDCMDDKIDVQGSLGIFTNQVSDGTEAYATITSGDISLVVDSPPIVTGTAAATMGVMGFIGIHGILHVDDAYLDHINGSIDGAGKDTMDNPMAMTASFMAPACGSFKK
jgi:hypothetical protein